MLPPQVSTRTREWVREFLFGSGENLGNANLHTLSLF
jgi:hypothetical protein